MNFHTTYRINYGLSNRCPEAFSLDQFLESDASGTLSWLNMEANDPNSDIPLFREVEASSVELPSLAQS